jgi:hypothetical protein
VLAFLLVLFLGLTAAGCDSIDPTDQSTAVVFQNDLNRPVALRLCDDSSCTSFDYTDEIARGGTDEENISDRGILTRWLVAGSSGRTLGCLPLKLSGKYAGLSVRLAEMVRCPGETPLALRHGRKTSGEV